MIAVMRRSTIVALTSAVVALTVVGCGTRSSSPVFSRADLPRVVSPRPPLPKRTRWIDVTTSDGDNRALGFEGFLDPGPLLDELRKTDFQLGYHMIWSADARAPYEYRNEAAYAFLFRTASGARTALKAFRHYTPKLLP